MVQIPGSLEATQLIQVCQPQSVVEPSLQERRPCILPTRLVPQGSLGVLWFHWSLGGDLGSDEGTEDESL